MNRNVLFRLKTLAFACVLVLSEITPLAISSVRADDDMAVFRDYKESGGTSDSTSNSPIYLIKNGYASRAVSAVGNKTDDGRKYIEYRSGGFIPSQTSKYDYWFVNHDGIAVGRNTSDWDYLTSPRAADERIFMYAKIIQKQETTQPKWQVFVGGNDIASSNFTTNKNTTVGKLSSYIYSYGYVPNWKLGYTLTDADEKQFNSEISALCTALGCTPPDGNGLIFHSSNKARLLRTAKLNAGTGTTGKVRLFFYTDSVGKLGIIEKRYKADGSADTSKNSDGYTKGVRELGLSDINDLFKLKSVSGENCDSFKARMSEQVPDGSRGKGKHEEILVESTYGETDGGWAFRYAPKLTTSKTPSEHVSIGRFISSKNTLYDDLAVAGNEEEGDEKDDADDEDEDSPESGIQNDDKYATLVMRWDITDEIDELLGNSKNTELYFGIMKNNSSNKSVPAYIHNLLITKGTDSNQSLTVTAAPANYMEEWTNSIALTAEYNDFMSLAENTDAQYTWTLPDGKTTKTGKTIQATETGTYTVVARMGDSELPFPYTIADGAKLDTQSPVFTRNESAGVTCPRIIYGKDGKITVGVAGQDIGDENRRSGIAAAIISSKEINGESNWEPVKFNGSTAGGSGDACDEMTSESFDDVKNISPGDTIYVGIRDKAGNTTTTTLRIGNPPYSGDGSVELGRLMRESGEEEYVPAPYRWTNNSETVYYEYYLDEKVDARDVSEAVKWYTSVGGVCTSVDDSYQNPIQSSGNGEYAVRVFALDGNGLKDSNNWLGKNYEEEGNDRDNAFGEGVSASITEEYIDTNAPVVTVEEATNILKYSVTDDNADGHISGVRSVKIYPSSDHKNIVRSRTVGGTDEFEIPFNDTYVIEAEDNAGNHSTATVEINRTAEPTAAEIAECISVGIGNTSDEYTNLSETVYSGTGATNKRVVLSFDKSRLPADEQGAIAEDGYRWESEAEYAKNKSGSDGFTSKATRELGSNDKNGVYYLTVKLTNGKEICVSTEVECIDTKVPNLSIAPEIKNGQVDVTTTANQVFLTATDGMSGVHKIVVRNEGSGEESTVFTATRSGMLTPPAASFVTSGNSSRYTIHVYDWTGNEKTQEIAIRRNSSIGDDGAVIVRTSPINVIAENGGAPEAYSKDKVTATVSLSDDSLYSILDPKPYRWNNGEWGTVTSQDITSNGTYSVSVKDINGRTVTKTFEVKGIDNIEPSISIADEKVKDDALSFNVTLRDDDSGLKDVKVFAINDAGNATPKDLSGNTKCSFNIEGSPADVAYVVAATDNAGNASVEYVNTNGTGGQGGSKTVTSTVTSTRRDSGDKTTVKTTVKSTVKTTTTVRSTKTTTIHDGDKTTVHDGEKTTVYGPGKTSTVYVGGGNTSTTKTSTSTVAKTSTSVVSTSGSTSNSGSSSGSGRTSTASSSKSSSSVHGSSSVRFNPTNDEDDDLGPDVSLREENKTIYIDASDEGSGLDRITLVRDGEEKTLIKVGGDSSVTYRYSPDKDGEYTFVVYDRDENKTEKSIKISDMTADSTTPVGEVTAYPVDIDGDGNADGWAVDNNNDNLPDIFMVDTDGDGVPDRTVSHIRGLDLNGDGKIDAWGIDSNGDGVIDVFLVDTDGDGYPDSVMIDTDGDGIPDKEVSKTAAETITLGEGGKKDDGKKGGFFSRLYGRFYNMFGNRILALLATLISVLLILVLIGLIIIFIIFKMKNDDDDDPDDEYDDDEESEDDGEYSDDEEEYPDEYEDDESEEYDDGDSYDSEDEDDEVDVWGDDE